MRYYVTYTTDKDKRSRCLRIKDAQIEVGMIRLFAEDDAFFETASTWRINRVYMSVDDEDGTTHIRAVPVSVIGLDAKTIFVKTTAKGAQAFDLCEESAGGKCGQSDS